jgi:preprotein translocase subunit SecG
MTTSTVIILVLAIAVIIFVAVMLFQREKTQKLKSKFGPEYDRLVDKEGSPRRAEAVWMRGNPWLKPTS